MIITVEMVVAGISTVGLILTMLWNIHGFKKESEKEAVRTANIELKLCHIAEDITEIKLQQKRQNENDSVLRMDVEILKRDLKTAFDVIEDIKQHL